MSRDEYDHLRESADAEAKPVERYGYGDSGHKYAPDRHGRCRYAGSGYCDGTPTDTAHEKRPARR